MLISNPRELDMADYRPINPETANVHGWLPVNDFNWARDIDFCPIQVCELSALLDWFVIAFQKKCDGQFLPGVILGLQELENLFVAADGKWVGNYVPAFLRCYPFSLQEIRHEEERKFVLTFDHSSGRYLEDITMMPKALTFFKNGELRPGLQNMVKFLIKNGRGQVDSRKAVALINSFDLFEPLSALKFNGAVEIPNSGALYAIARDKVDDLSGADLKKLQEAKALELIFAHLHSIARLGVLQKLRSKRLEADVNISREQSSDVDFLVGASGDNIDYNF